MCLACSKVTFPIADLKVSFSGGFLAVCAVRPRTRRNPLSKARSCFILHLPKTVVYNILCRKRASCVHEAVQGAASCVHCGLLLSNHTLITGHGDSRISA